jgi:two-component system, LuxR family, sensor kinase FixL
MIVLFARANEMAAAEDAMTEVDPSRPASPPFPSNAAIDAPRTDARNPNLTSRDLVTALLLAIGYYAGVHVGIALTGESSPIAILWPPNAILLAALLLTRPRAWWVIIAAAGPAHLAAELSLGVPWVMAMAWLASNVTEALIGAVLITRILDCPPRFDRVRDLSVFLLAGVLVSPLASSFLDASFVALVGWRYTGDYWEVWRIRVFSNALGTLMLVPLIVSWVQRGLGPLRQISGREYAEMGVMLLGICLTSTLVFRNSFAPEATAALMYAPLPFLLWAAVRHDVPTVSLCVAIVALSAITGVIENRGPFASNAPEDEALAVQAILIVTAASVLLLAASLAELRDAKAVAVDQEERLHLALGAAQMGTWEWDIAQDRMILRSGRTAEPAVDTPSRQRPLSELLEQIHPEDRGAVAHAIDEMLATRGSGQVEYRLLRRNGGYRWMYAKGKVVVDAKGKPQRLIGVHIDTTQRKLEELRSREQRDQLTHLSRISLLGELSGALAHELNQPLTAIMLNAQAARRALDRPMSNIPDVDDILTDIISDGRRAGDVIARLRALFARGEIAMLDVSANECIREVLVLEHSDLIRRGVTTDVRLESGLPSVVADRVQLQQVLLNLIVNACDAMADNNPGERRLRIATAANGGREVRIEIEDNGHGIDDADKIFEPFFTTKAHGIGLGLAICRTIVAAHGGVLWASSNPARGATFHLSIPAARSR